jgi:hypothetical protein
MEISPIAPLTRPARLILPYSALGLAGGWMIADFFRVGALQVDAGLRPALTMGTPLAAAALGLALSPAVRWPAWKALLVSGVGIVAAGVTTGALIGVMMWSRYGLADGAASGLGCALALLPAFGAVLAAARRVGRAREGSLLDASDRRAVWLAAAAAVAFGSIAVVVGWPVPGAGPRPGLGISRSLGVLALSVITAILLQDLAGLFRVRSATASLRIMRPCDPAAPDALWAGERLDLGVGNEMAARVVPAATAYREIERVDKVIQGDPAAARRAFGRSIACGVAALALAVTAIAAADASGALFD